MAETPGRGIVAAQKTTPQTVLEDIEHVMRLADFESALPKDVTTGLKINISWQTWYPACSSAPWQIEGAIKALQNAGYNDLVGVHNDTVVVDTRVGEMNNKHRHITDMYDIPCIYLYEEDFEWFEYVPKRPLLALDKIYRDGVFIPRAIVGLNMLHLPTIKTHVFTTITGAMKNAFGGLLHRNRHWAHAAIHDTLVDLLMIQQEIHPGLFALMDGTFAGNGPGPRAMRWHKKDILLASADQVAIDAVSAKLQGFDPMSLRFIRRAHELGLGVGDPSQIKVVGYDIEKEPPWGFRREDTFASWGQEMIYHGALKPFETLLLRTRLVPWSYFASNFYHNVYWYPFVGRKRVRAALETDWGELFRSYGDGQVVMPGMEPKTVLQAAIGIAALAALAAVGLGILLRR